MSSISYIEKGGQRIETTDLETHWEIRCDGCGEFIPQGSRANGVLSLTERGREVGMRHWDAHEEHRLTAIQATFERIMADITPL